MNQICPRRKQTMRHKEGIFAAGRTASAPSAGRNPPDAARTRRPGARLCGRHPVDGGTRSPYSPAAIQKRSSRRSEVIAPVRSCSLV